MVVVMLLRDERVGTGGGGEGSEGRRRERKTVGKRGGV